MGLLSQTGAASLEVEGKEFRLEIEVKSVNGKGLQLSCSFPYFLEKLEPQVHRIASDILKRGSVRLRVRVEFFDDVTPLDELPDQAIAKLKKFLEQSKELGFKEVGIIEAIKFLKLNRVERENPELEKAFLEAVKKAFELLQEERAAEGERLKKWFLKTLVDINQKINWLSSVKDAIFERNVKLLKEALGKAIDSSVDDKHVLALLHKAVYTEEIERLQVHLSRIEQIINSDEDKKGYKLDFLLQECLRELNTLASKAQDADVSDVVSDVKVKIVEMREQVANVL